jgi:hypothetical protein
VSTCLILPGQAGTVTVALPAPGTAIETDVRSHDENSATAGPFPEVADHRVVPGPQDDQAGVRIRERAVEVLAEMPLQQVARGAIDPLPDDRAMLGHQQLGAGGGFNVLGSTDSLAAPVRRATGGQEGANHRSADLAKSLAGARCHEPTHSSDGGHVVRLGVGERPRNAQVRGLGWVERAGSRQGTGGALAAGVGWWPRQGAGSTDGTWLTWFQVNTYARPPEGTSSVRSLPPAAPPWP